MKAKKLPQRARVAGDFSWSAGVKLWDRYANDNAEAIVKIAGDRALAGDIIAIGLLMELSKASIKQARRSRLKADARKEVIQKFQHRCYHCGAEGSTNRGPDGLHWHLDHLVPLCEGGSDDLENLVLSCATCNGDKGRSLDWSRETENKQ